MSQPENIPPEFAKSNKTPRSPISKKGSSLPLRVAEEENSSKRRKIKESPMDLKELSDKLLAANKELSKQVQDSKTVLSNKIDEIQKSNLETKQQIQEVRQLFEEKIKDLENQMDNVVAQLRTVTEENEYLKTQLQKQGDVLLQTQEHLYDNYILVKGLPENSNETPDVTKIEIDKLLHNIGANNCTSAKRIGQGSRPRLIKAYFLSQDDRHLAFSKKKNLPNNIYMNAVEPHQLRNAKSRLRYKRKLLASDGIENEIDFKNLTISYLGVTTHWSEITLPPSNHGVNTSPSSFSTGAADGTEPPNSSTPMDTASIE